jgi:hypothetical protein
VSGALFPCGWAVRGTMLLVAAMLLAACPSPPPLDVSGFYRCEDVGDCPEGWFCRADAPGEATRCWSTPECTVDDANICDDGLACTVDACDDAAGACTHTLAPATCIGGAASIAAG